MVVARALWRNSPMRHGPSAQHRMKRLPSSAVALGVVALLALVATPTHAQVTRSGAATSMAGCEPQQFYVPQRGGECWECPAGFIRSQAPLLSRSACTKPQARNAQQHARGSGVMGTDCPSGQFWDPSGHCYSCPDGYQRSQAAVQSSRACRRGGRVEFAAARLAQAAYP